jgi:hypothetical protein
LRQQHGERPSTCMESWHAQCFSQTACERHPVHAPTTGDPAPIGTSPSQESVKAPLWSSCWRGGIRIRLSLSEGSARRLSLPKHALTLPSAWAREPAASGADLTFAPHPAAGPARRMSNPKLH